MTKRERKLNNLWNYLQKTCTKETLQNLNLKAFLYSVGRITYEEALIYLSCTFLGKDISTDCEVKSLIDILNK